MPAARAETVYVDADQGEVPWDKEACLQRREEIMRKAAKSMRHLHEVMDLAVRHLVEGDADLADLIVPAR